ncbi:MAG: ROK family protein [Actinomycetales bacterium]
MVEELPRLALLRQLSDRHVLTAVLAAGRLTRAELAAATGLSKPTVSQSVSRLEANGVLQQAGRSTGGRGRAGTYLEATEGAGVGVAMHAGPDGVGAQVVSLAGDVVRKVSHQVSVPTTSRQLSSVLREVAAQAVVDLDAPVRAACLSVADPVDRQGQLVHLPNSPFLVGDLDPAETLAGALPVHVQVDNDVNWALLAEREQGCAQGADDVLYLYLDEGLGAAIVADGHLVRGARGLAGEVAYLPTGSGALHRLVRRLDLTRQGQIAVDVARARALLDGETAAAAELVASLCEAIHGVCYLLDPALVVLAGGWGSHRRLATGLADLLAADPGLGARVELASVPDASLQGALLAARRTLVEAVLQVD